MNLFKAIVMGFILTVAFVILLIFSIGGILIVLVAVWILASIVSVAIQLSGNTPPANLYEIITVCLVVCTWCLFSYQVYVQPEKLDHASVKRKRDDLY